MNQENLLPLGSVVYLKEGTVPLLIVARQPLLELGEIIYYVDYGGVNQLTGLSNIEEIAYFNREDIREVLHEGYVSENEKTVLKALREWKENNLEFPKGSIVNLKQTIKEEKQKNLNKNKFRNEETFGF